MGKKQTTLKLLIVPFMVLGFVFAFGGKAHAASITVNTDINPSACTLDEAIININDQAQTNTDCVETGSYGTNDTINIPAGTITLTASLPEIEQSVHVQGQGIGQSVINGDGQWQALRTFTTPIKTITIEKLTVTAYSRFAVVLHNTNTTINQVEIDGTGAVFPTGVNSSGYGIVVSNEVPGQIVSNIINVHVHGITSNNTDTTFGILVTTGDSGAANSGNVVSNINSATVEGITGSGNVFGIATGAGMYSFGLGNGAMNSTVSNTTITNINSTNGTAGGYAAVAIAAMGHSTTALLQNATIAGISGAVASPLIGTASSGVIAFAGGFVNDLHQQIDLTVRNTLVANSGLSCTTYDVSSLFGTNSTSDINLGSLGGNITDDSACASNFTQPTDQNNLTDLSSTLGTLSDNGGYVPTIPLLQGSPAIDSGVTVTGLTTDARIATRPQGAGYDSGAYESPYSKPAGTTASLASSGQNTLPYVLISFITIVSAVTMLDVPHQLKATM